MERATHQHQHPTDPPGTPPISSSMLHVDERSDRNNDLDTISSRIPFNGGDGGCAPKKIPPAFNRTRPSPLVPRKLFPTPEENTMEGHKSPPSVNRKSQEKIVFLWELEDEDDIPSDSSVENGSPFGFGISEQAVLSRKSGTQKKGTSFSERGEDVTSDLGYNHLRVKSCPNTPRQNKSSSEAAGPTKSFSFHALPSQRVSSALKETPRGDIPQSPDEHSARLKEILNEREKTKRKKKTKNRSNNTDDSDDYCYGSSVVSGASNTRTSSKYTDDPVNYLNEKLHSSEKKRNSFRSDDAEGSAVSRGSNGSGAKFEKKYNTKVVADDKASDVSGGSNTSSVFAATRAKLKGYLTSYKKKDKKVETQTEPNTSATAAASPLSPVRGSPSTLFSIEESEPDSALKMSLSKSPRRTPKSSSRKSFEEKISHLSTPPRIHTAVESDTTTQVINLPWCHDSKDASLDENSITGLYSGPVNELLQPHGKGKLVLKANNSLAFHGTWEDGKLVSPLTDEKEPTTDDEGEINEPKNSEVGLDIYIHDHDSPRERMKKPTQTDLQGTTSIKYDVNSHHNHRRISNPDIARESAALGKVREKAAKKKRCKRMPLVRYNLGDACRTPQDMIICRSKHAATESASLLRKWDGAFIKRSSGVWTYAYAVLIERAPQALNVPKKRLEYFFGQQCGKWTLAMRWKIACCLQSMVMVLPK